MKIISILLWFFVVLSIYVIFFTDDNDKPKTQ